MRPGSVRRVLAWLLTAAGCALASRAAAQSGAAPGDTAGALQLEAGTFAARAGPIDVRNGVLRVPADRGRPASGLLRLRFVLFPALTPRPGPTIVFLAGGPGDSGIRAFRGIPPDFLEGLRRIGDVVALDQRGTGISEPLDPRCLETMPLPLDRPGEEALYGPIYRDRLERCLATQRTRGIDVAGLTSAESADDLEALRRALGDARRMSAGDWSELARWALAYRRRPWTDVLNLAMDCASYASEGRLTAIRAGTDTSLLRDVADFPKPGLCDTPGLPRLPDGFRAPVISSVPALLISGRLDARTPPENAREVAAGLPRARLLTVPNASHDLLGQTRVRREILDFLRERL